MSSPTSRIPFFGQAWELIVRYQTADGTTRYETITTDAWQPEALHITFDVLQSTLPSPFWYADIIIYNLTATEVQEIVFNATWVTLKAGFQTGPALSSIIWDGPIFQVAYDQENVVDQRITLHCLANPLVMDNLVAFSQGIYTSQAQLLARAAEAINLPPMSTQQGTLSPYAAQALDQKRYPRGNTVFGKFSKTLSLLSDDQFMTNFRDGSQAYMTEYDNGTAVPTPELTYSPPSPPDAEWSLPPEVTQTIIGTPRQTAQGVIFTVLLDPRLKVQVPIQVVQLVRALPTQLAVNPDPNQSFVSPLNTNLTFFVGQLRHVGDSRGNDWYTEVTGFATTYASALLSGNFAASTGA